MSRFIDAYSVSTGRKQTIPEHWLALFPGHFRPTPKQRSKDRNRGERNLDGAGMQRRNVRESG
jgi:hypothetical protein